MKHKKLAVLVLILMLAGGASAGVLEFFQWLGQVILEWIILALSAVLIWPILGLSLESIRGLLGWSPTVFCFPNQPSCTVTPGINAIYPFVIDILIPIYIVAMMFTALFFIMKAGSPAGRVRARKMFFRLIIGMFFVIYAPMMYQMLIDISARITDYYLAKVEFWKIIALTSYGKAAALCCLQICMLLTAIVTLIIILARWFYVYIYALFFPLVLFLYFFEITKPYGSKYIKDTMRWIFVPPLQALILYIMVAGPMSTFAGMTVTGGIMSAPALQSLFTQLIGVFIVLGGMITMCAAPMVMTQILQFVGMAIYSAGLAIDNVPLMSMGGVIAGQGPAALSNAHGHFSRMRAYEGAMSSIMGGSMAKSAPAAMRMVGGQRGADEGHRGGAGGGGTGGGAAGGTSSRAQQSAAERRGAPGMPSLSGKLDEAKAGYSNTYKEEPKEYKRDVNVQPGREREVGSGKGLTSSDLLEARDEASGVDRDVDFSPKGLAGERSMISGSGKTGLLDELQQRDSASMGALGPKTAQKPPTMAGPQAGATSAIKPIAQAGGAQQRKRVETHTDVYKTPDEVKEGDTRIEDDEAAKKRREAKAIDDAKKKISAEEKHAAEKTALQRDILSLQQKLKYAQQEEKGKTPDKKKKKD